MSAAWDITVKDLFLIVRDRRTFAVLLLLPLVFIVIIGLTTGKFLGWRSSNQRLKIAAVDAVDYDAIGTTRFLVPPAADADEADEATDADEAAGADSTPVPAPLSAAEREGERRVAGHLVVGVLNGVQQAPGVEVRTVEGWGTKLGVAAATGDPAEAARALVADERVDAALVFTPDFYRRVYHLDPADLVGRDADNPLPIEKLEELGIEIVSSDPKSSTTSAITAIVGYQVFSALMPVTYCRSRDWTIAERGSPRYRRVCGPVDRMADTPPPGLEPPQADREGGIADSVYEELVPSYTVMFVFFLVNIMARSFLHERDLGTLRRLRIAPVPPWALLAGKTLPFLAVSLAQTALLFLAGRLLFGMSWGADPWMLLPVIFATSAAATGLGLLIATLVRSDAQVSAYATTAVIVLAGISGCFMPRKWLPDLMQEVSLATPHAWALIAYDQLLSTPSPNLATVWQCVGMLLAFAAGFFVLGGVRFRSVD